MNNEELLDLVKTSGHPQHYEEIVLQDNAKPPPLTMLPRRVLPGS